MYLKFFNLKTKPFELSPDPRFLWLGEKHKEGLAVLRYGILTNKGFISITGDVGTGKTTLLNGLAKSFDENFIFARIPDPNLETLDFLNFTASAFKMDKRFRGKGEFLSELAIFLKKAHSGNKEVILIIDEAQRIKKELLEDIRLISNIERPEKKLINIIFSGQNDFHDLLNSNKALRNRLAFNYIIEPLTENDTADYIRHRLKIAGSESQIFSMRAIQEIYSFSQGNPRQINIICDLALLHGYIAETETIEPAIVNECIKRTLIPFVRSEPLVESQKIQTIVPQKKTQVELSKESRRPLNKTLRSRDSIFSRHRTAYLAPVPLIILISLIGMFFYPDEFNSSISSLKSYFNQAVNRLAKPISDDSLYQSQVVNVPTRPSSDRVPQELASRLEDEKNRNDRLTDKLAEQAELISTLQKELEKAQNEQIKLKRHLHINRQATALLKTQVKELNSEKAASKARLAELQTAHSALIAEIEKQKPTNDQILQLKNTLADKDRQLMQNEKRRLDLEKKIEQANISEAKLNGRLAEKETLVAELQSKLKIDRSHQEERERQLQKMTQEVVSLQDQIKNLRTQKALAKNRADKLQTAYNTLVADFEELQNTNKIQVAELESAIADRDRQLERREQRQQELENTIEQSNIGKVKLDSENTAKTALIADLRNELEASRNDQAALKEQLLNIQQETVLLQSQVRELNKQRASSQSRIEYLQTAQNAAVADTNEMKNTRAQVARLTNELAVKDRLVTQRAQQLQELETDLVQAQESKDQLIEDLSARSVLAADLQKKLDAFREHQMELESQLQKSRQETTLLQTKLKDLNIQKTSSETKIEELQTAYNSLAANLEEMKAAKAEVAELRNQVAVNNQKLTQSRQRQQNLEKELAHARKIEDELNSEISTHAARVEDLQSKLEATRADQAARALQLQNTRQELARLQQQLSDLKTKTSISPTALPAHDSEKRSPPEKEKGEEITEPPDPADVIDWIIKKKSE